MGYYRLSNVIKQGGCYHLHYSFYILLAYYVNYGNQDLGVILIMFIWVHYLHHHHHICKSRATKSAFISSTTLRYLSIHLIVVPENSTSGINIPLL